MNKNNAQTVKLVDTPDLGSSSERSGGSSPLPGTNLSQWSFDRKVAEIFPTHARQHIPNYDKVIQKTLDICTDYPSDASIIDVGCAVGETLIQLHHRGFTNLYGVDNSTSMLEKCPKTLGIEYILSDNFKIDKTFDVIIINWTLHFIENKTDYLYEVKSRLNQNGTLIISDKTCNDDYAIEFYHNIKRQNGVSEAEIVAKQNNVKNIMFIKSPNWYLNQFEQLGLHNHYIFDADWCFTSFVCKCE